MGVQDSTHFGVARVGRLRVDVYCPWSGSRPCADGRRPLKTREWDRHVAPGLLEALPEGWSAYNGHLSTVAADGHLAWHISRQVSRSGGFEFHALIQPLYIYSTVLVGNFDEILGHGDTDVRSFFIADTPDEVPLDEIVSLVRRFAFPYFERYGTDLRSFLTLTTGFARTTRGQRDLDDGGVDGRGVQPARRVG